MKLKLTQTLFSLLLALPLCGCVSYGLPDEARFERKLNAEIPAGTPRSSAEATLLTNGVTTSYDRFRNKLQGTIRSTETELVSLVVQVELDDQANTKRISVVKTYTGP
jgi:hypothetical protein